MAASIRLPGLIPVAVLALGAAALGWLAGVNPGLAIAAALGLAFTLVVFANLYAGVVLFTVLTFVAAIPGLGGSSVTFAKFAGLLLLLSWLAVLAMRSDARADFPSVHPLVTCVLVLFLSWIAITQLWASDPVEAREAVFSLALNAILFLIIFTAVRTPGQAIGAIAAFVGGATIAAVYGLAFVAPRGTEEAARLSGTLDNPNELATILVAALALSLGLAGALRGAPLARLAALGAGVLCLAGVFLTGSRGGLVALAVALLAFLVTGARFRGRLLIAGLVIAVAGLTYYSYVASPDARARISEVGSGSGRTDLWTVAWRMVEDDPVKGIGAGNFPTTSVHFLLEPGVVADSDLFVNEPKVVHNSYLETWAELGIVGLGLFLCILGFGLYAAGKAMRTFARHGDHRMELIARSLFVALAAVFAADFFGSRQYNKELWFLLGLAPALWAIARARGADLDTDAASDRGPVGG
jgi:O-antigen ligase